MHLREHGGDTVCRGQNRVVIFLHGVGMETVVVIETKDAAVADLEQGRTDGVAGELPDLGLHL